LLQKDFPTAMTDQSALDAATRRLSLAIDALEGAVERRYLADRGEDGLAAQLHALGSDRSRLAADLDNATAHARELETTNRAVARRLDATIETIRSVLEANQ
jgi:hypothetical protein